MSSPVSKSNLHPCVISRDEAQHFVFALSITVINGLLKPFKGSFGFITTRLSFCNYDNIVHTKAMGTPYLTERYFPYVEIKQPILTF